MLGGISSIEVIVLYLITGAVAIGVPLALVVFAWRWLRAYERRTAPPPEIAELRTKVEKLRGQVANLMVDDGDRRGAERLHS